MEKEMDPKLFKKAVKPALGRGLSSLISSPMVSVVPPNQPPQQPNFASPYTVLEGGLARDVSKEIQAKPAEAEVEIDGQRTKVRYVKIGEIIGNPTQPRQTFNDSELQELSSSIKTHGLLQPVLVRPSAKYENAKYEIIAGERRWRAAKLAELSELPVIIQEISDKEALEIALVENVQRSNLNPVEEAEAYQRLATEFSLTQQEIADRVGKDRASVSNFIRLLKLAPEALECLRKNEISMGHAKALLTIKEPAAQLSLCRKVLEEGMSVRALEAIVSRSVVLEAPQTPSRFAKDGRTSAGVLNPFPEAIDRMRNALGTKVTIKHHAGGRGRIEIEYFSEQELDRLVDQICRA